MEDAHTTLLELEDAKEAAFFAVYDGHGGKGVNLFVLILFWNAFLYET